MKNKPVRSKLKETFSDTIGGSRAHAYSVKSNWLTVKGKQEFSVGILFVSLRKPPLRGTSRK